MLSKDQFGCYVKLFSYATFLLSCEWLITTEVFQVISHGNFLNWLAIWIDWLSPVLFYLKVSVVCFMRMIYYFSQTEMFSHIALVFVCLTCQGWPNLRLSISVFRANIIHDSTCKKIIVIIICSILQPLILFFKLLATLIDVWLISSLLVCVECVIIDINIFLLIFSEYWMNDTNRLLGQRKGTRELCMHWRSWTKNSLPKKIKQLMWCWSALYLINWIILPLCGYILHFKILFHCVGILIVISL